MVSSETSSLINSRMSQNNMEMVLEKYHTEDVFERIVKQK